MDFIDKLEKFLLRPRAKVYHGASRYQGSNKVFFNLGCIVAIIKKPLDGAFV